MRRHKAGARVDASTDLPGRLVLSDFSCGDVKNPAAEEVAVLTVGVANQLPGFDVVRACPACMTPRSDIAQCCRGPKHT